MSRYSAVPASDGLFLVDTDTGQVTHIREGGDVRVLYAGPGLDAGPGQLGGEHDAADEVVLATYPTPLARGWERVLVTHEPRQRALALIDAFTTLVKLWGVASAAAYLRRTDLRDPSAHHHIASAFSRPLIGAWPRMVELVMPLLHDDPDPFIGALLAAYRRCETKCRDKVRVELSFRDVDGTERSNVSNLGLVSALVSFRNQVAHAPGRPASTVEKELAVYEPAMKRLLVDAAFMSRTPLVEVLRKKKGQTEARLWMGRRGGERSLRLDPERLPGDAGSFALVDEEGSTPALPLAWFCASGTAIRAADDMLLYEGCTRRGVRYVTLAGDQHDIRSPLAALEATLSERAPERRVNTLDRLTWEELSTAATTHTTAVLENLRTTGAFSDEMSIEREAMRLGLEELLRDEKTALVVTGDPGTGKTTLLARWVKELQEAGDAVFFHRLGGGAGVGLVDRWRTDLGLDRPHPLLDVARRLAALAPAGKRVWLVVDGLAAAADATTHVVADFQQWVTECAAYPALKAIATVRQGAYQRLPEFRRFGAGAESLYVQRRDDNERVLPVVPLPPFTPEELEQAYTRTRAASARASANAELGSVRQCPSNTFPTLDPSGTTVRLMKTPVVMRLLMQAYDGVELPSDVRLREAMSLFVEHVVIGQGADREGGVRRLHLLRGIVREMERRQTELVPLDDLFEVSALAPALQASGADAPYVVLRDRGLVVERWRGNVLYVQLGSVQLFEYLLAQLVAPTVRSVERFLLAARSAADFGALRGALEQCAHAALEDDGPRLLVDVLDACDDDRWADSREVVLDVVGRVMLSLARLGGADLPQLLDALQEAPSLTDAELLLRVADRAESLGHAEASKAFLAALVATVERLDAEPLRGRTHVLEVRSLYARGHLEEAVARADEAPASYSPSESADLALFRGRALVDLRKHERAIGDLKTAYDLSIAHHDLTRAAEARRWWGVALSRNGDVEGFDAAVDEALALARRAGDRLVEARALHYVARRAVVADELERAASIFAQVRRLAISEGDAKLAGAAWSDLGVTRSRQGRVDEARAAYGEAATAFERAQAPRMLCSTLTSLALLERDEGEHALAAQRLARVAALSRQIKTPAVLSLALWLRGEVLLDAGEVPAAAACAVELDDVTLEGVDALRRAVWSASLSARIAVARGEAAPAVAAARQRLAATLEADGLPTLQPFERPERALRDLDAADAVGG